jgi:hypothetical protein
MRCHICDKSLSEKETIYNKDLQAYEPCTVCLDIAMDAAYCDGVQRDEEYECVVLDASFDDAEASFISQTHLREETSSDE